MLAEAVNSAALATALNDTNDNTKLIRIELRKLKKVHFGSLLDNAPNKGIDGCIIQKRSFIVLGTKKSIKEIYFDS